MSMDRVESTYTLTPDFGNGDTEACRVTVALTYEDRCVAIYDDDEPEHAIWVAISDIDTLCALLIRVRDKKGMR